ncbi:cell division protein FtsL [Rhodoferax sp. OV413]|uniref:cell division protein FtsL n=1 Tax=Rhodoferax sp. OV413 TaxID=1855285 RepID=UPI0025E8A823|nr:cell division protein FtsL [Rhodoferax sp. OV413]
MIRLSLLLLVALVGSALFLVSVQYDSRRLFTELDKARADARRLETEHGRLQVAKREQATSARVEQLAREKLQMHQVTPAITNYVTYAAPVASAATNSVAPGGKGAP